MLPPVAVMSTVPDPAAIAVSPIVTSPVSDSTVAWLLFVVVSIDVTKIAPSWFTCRLPSFIEADAIVNVPVARLSYVAAPVF